LLEFGVGSKILDAGAGRQFYKQFYSRLDYVSQDFGQYDGLGDNVGLHPGSYNNNVDIISDIINIPEPNNSFDQVLSTEVFEHLPNPILAIKEFNRILKVKGNWESKSKCVNGDR